MRKLNCPQCYIPNFYVKNESRDRRLVYVMEDLTICTKNEDESLEGFNLEIIYCLGCSWSGSPARLKQTKRY